MAKMKFYIAKARRAAGLSARTPLDSYIRQDAENMTAPSMPEYSDTSFYDERDSHCIISREYDETVPAYLSGRKYNRG